jgi:hypothetical protein
MALLRRVLASFVLVATGYLIALILIPPAADAWMPRGSPVHLAEPSKPDCKDQRWPNADRVCLTWTAPRDMDARTDGRRP